MSRLIFVVRSFLLVVITALLAACAHPISITPSNYSDRGSVPVSQKKVAYVMTDSDRNKEVTTAGGGGDKVSYYPYRDLERSIRDTLGSIYSDVYVLSSPTDIASIRSKGIALVFTPEISTVSSSSSMFTWPPTRFIINLSCTVTDQDVSLISKIKASGEGEAEFSEFASDFGLAGKRAAEDLSKKLKMEILYDSRLR